LREQEASDSVFDAICFHAQQCVEKYLKAWLTEQGVDFPKTHDLEALAKLCLPFLPELQSLMDDLRFLTSFAVEIRYPGILTSKPDAEHCFHIALKGRNVLRRQSARRRAKPESVLRETEGALVTLASEWKKTFETFQQAGSTVPPVLIVVCDNTNLSELVHEHIANGNVLPELENRSHREITLRIDTKLLNEAESAIEGETKKQVAEYLRKTVDTVGKTEWQEEGEPPILPVIERFCPIGSTSEVLFRTVRPSVGTTKSHISHVVLDAPKWEHSVAFQLEQMPEVLAYAKNDHLDFTIPYEW